MDGSAALIYYWSADQAYMALLDRVTHEPRVLPNSAYGEALINGDGTMMVNIRYGDAYTPLVMYSLPI